MIARLIHALQVLLMVFLVGLSALNTNNNGQHNTCVDAAQTTTGCTCALDEELQDDFSGARIAYLVTVHNYRTAEDAAHLFRAIRAPQNIIIIHLDTKMSRDVYENSTLFYQVENCPCGAQVHVDSVHNAKWSSWSMNDPTFWGMQMTVSDRFRNQWDVFVNLSGDTMPVVTADVMSDMFASFKGINFVTSSSCSTGLLPSSIYIWPDYWHKRAHYVYHRDGTRGDPVLNYVDEQGRPQSIKMTIHFGSQWMALQPDLVEYLIKEMKRPDSLASRYKAWLIRHQKLMTDETFIPTLLMHVPPFNNTLPAVDENDSHLKDHHPTLHHLRYERMDENVPTAFGEVVEHQRYEVPNSSIADAPKPWGPYFLGVYDLANILDSGALFVRKVSTFVDANLVNLLPVKDPKRDLPYIQWPMEVKISDRIDWKARMAELRRRNWDGSGKDNDNNDDEEL